MATGETEFGGVGGLIAPRTAATGTETFQQQTWEVYATDEGGEGVSTLPTADRVGRIPPRESYTPNAWNSGL